MTLLPIQFWNTYNKDDFENLSSKSVLDVIENYLEEKGFNYIKRTENKIIFHSIFDGWGGFDIRTTLVSGVVKINENGKKIKIINGNWLSLIIALPFLIFILLAKSRFSTLDENDLDLVWNAFAVIYIGNLIIRIVSHILFKERINNLVKKNYAPKAQ